MMDAAPEYSLCSLKTVKERVNVAKDTDEFDAALGQFSRMATQLIEGELGIQFKAKSYVQFADTYKNYRWEASLASLSLTSGMLENVTPARVMLRGYPLADDVTVDVRYAPGTRLFDDESVIPAEYVVVEPEGGRMILTYPLETAERSLKLTYTAGYAVDYETPAEQDAQDALQEDMDVSSTLTHSGQDAVAILFDEDADKSTATGGSASGSSARVSWRLQEPGCIGSARWYAPNDGTPGHSTVNLSSATLTLTGSVSGNWTGGADEVQIATRNYTGVQAGDVLELSAGAHAALYKGFRLTCSVTGATYIYAAQVSAKFKDASQAYLLGVPSRLTMATALLTKYLWSKDRTGGVGFKTATERRNAAFATDGVMPPEVVEMLQPYRRLRMA